jgi:hypothetical protein
MVRKIGLVNINSCVKETLFVFNKFKSCDPLKATIVATCPLGFTISTFKGSQDLNLLKTKSVSFTHEFMFTRPIFQTEDMINSNMSSWFHYIYHCFIIHVCIKRAKYEIYRFNVLLF